MTQSKQKLLILGSGGREHALAWRAVKEGFEVSAAPGSDGIAQHATCHPVDLKDSEAVLALAAKLGPAAVIIGPEQPLVDGLADRLEAAGHPTFGPSAAASRLEGSKAFSKAFMQRHEIPTASAVVCKDLASARNALEAMDCPPVVKASGLAAGKGVVVCETKAQAFAAIEDCFVQDRFGEAGQELLLESRLLGQEVSYFVLCDGERWLSLAPCQDHKRLQEGDQGPNTGGMGAYLPAPVVDAAVRDRIEQQVVKPTVEGLREEGMPFRGVIFIGLMIDPQGQPKVIEYNVRWGDPETQALMLGAQGPLVAQMVEIAQKAWSPRPVEFQASANVVMASAGYPQSSTKGSPISGLESDSQQAHCRIFHAGTRREGSKWLSHGGRVLGVSACGSTLEQALARAYARIEAISMPGAQIRRDIGHRALAQGSDSSHDR